MERFAEKTGRQARFNREARDLFLAFAAGPDAMWCGNFRDLSAAVMRMGTLAGDSRISTDIVLEEQARLTDGWRRLSGTTAETEPDSRSLLRGVLGERAGELDLFDAVQLACVIRECRCSRSLSDAGRRLFAESRKEKQKPNDADRLRKYLARFGLGWDDMCE